MEITEEVECLLHGYDACRRGSRSPRAEVVVSVERPGSGPARPSFLRARSRLLDSAIPIGSCLDLVRADLLLLSVLGHGLHVRLWVLLTSCRGTLGLGLSIYIVGTSIRI